MVDCQTPFVHQLLVWFDFYILLVFDNFSNPFGHFLEMDIDLSINCRFVELLSIQMGLSESIGHRLFWSG